MLAGELFGRPRDHGDPHHRRQPARGDPAGAEPDLGGAPRGRQRGTDFLFHDIHLPGKDVPERGHLRSVGCAVGAGRGRNGLLQTGGGHHQIRDDGLQKLQYGFFLRTVIGFFLNPV